MLCLRLLLAAVGGVDPFLRHSVEVPPVYSEPGSASQPFGPADAMDLALSLGVSRSRSLTLTLTRTLTLTLDLNLTPTADARTWRSRLQ